MGYTNETLHYGIPKPLGTDLTVPQDYNDAADAVDQALFDASTNVGEAVTAAANAVDAAAEAVEEVGNLGTEVNSLKGRTSALETSDVIQNNKIDALENQGVTKFDSVGIADAYVNGLTYSVGDVVTYNGQRYKCITAVVAAEPFDADKWSAEDVETALKNVYTGNSVYVLGDGIATWRTKLAALYALIDVSKLKVGRSKMIQIDESTRYSREYRINQFRGSVGNDAIDMYDVLGSTIGSITLAASGCSYNYYDTLANTTTDKADDIIPAGTKLIFEY